MPLVWGARDNVGLLNPANQVADGMLIPTTPWQHKRGDAYPCPARAQCVETACRAQLCSQWRGSVWQAWHYPVGSKRHTPPIRFILPTRNHYVYNLSTLYLTTYPLTYVPVYLLATYLSVQWPYLDTPYLCPCTVYLRCYACSQENHTVTFNNPQVCTYITPPPPPPPPLFSSVSTAYLPFTQFPPAGHWQWHSCALDLPSYYVHTPQRVMVTQIYTTICRPDRWCYQWWC